MANSTLWGNTDWWYTAIGGYGDVSNMLSTVSRTDGKGACGSVRCRMVEGFDGISDDMAKKVETENAPVTISEGQTASQVSGAPINSSPLLMKETQVIHHRYIDHHDDDDSNDRPRRKRKSMNWRGNYDQEDRGYYGRSGGDYVYDYNFVPVPIEVPVEVPVYHGNGMMSMLPLALAVLLGAFIIAMSRR